MKKIIFICVALIALLATNASGTNYHQTDKLQTHYVMQPQVQFTAITFEAQAWVITQPVIAIKTQTFVVGEMVKPNAFAWIDPGRNNLGISIQSKENLIGLNKSDQIPNQYIAVKVSDYNTTNYSYGLRY